VKTYLGESSERREEEDPNLEKYKEFLFAPDDLPVYVAAPKVVFLLVNVLSLFFWIREHISVNYEI